jgi:hypothetical protein
MRSQVEQELVPNVNHFIKRRESTLDLVLLRKKMDESNGTAQLESIPWTNQLND